MLEFMSYWRFTPKPKLLVSSTIQCRVLAMDSESSRKRKVIESEVDFWNEIAAECEKAIEHDTPQLVDLGDSFAYTSDKRFMERIGPVDGLRVLDLGCGLGALSLYVANLGADVVGIDIARGMICGCQRRSHRARIDASFMMCDAEHLPFRDDSFDRIVGARVIHHFPDLMGFFKEVYRVLRSNGRAVFIEPQRSNPIVEVNRKLLHPECRTEYEHPLTPQDIEKARHVFPAAEVETFYLISPIAWFFRFIVKNATLYETTSSTLQTAEKWLANTRYMRNYCWQVLLTMPKGDSNQTI